MFYKTANIPNDELNKDILLISNFLEKCPFVVKEIATDLSMMTLDATDKVYSNMEEIMASPLEFIVNSKRAFKHLNGDTYSGDFKIEVKSGIGEMTSKNRASYRGEWVNELPDGQGEFKQTDGKVVNGKCINGVFQKPFLC